ncbi:MAG TPA: RNA polymerase sigma factor, partial [Planctomycetota bacterium]|nr:RNA polymerase sigma factor [Planctomycetota bacterium]
MDAYLEHADWVRKLARELVRDPGTADDLVQETWLAFETARPDEQRSLRPWLARVLRNAAAMHKRRSAGRAAREEATASSERVASTGDLVARAEEQRRLAGLVLGLDEPYRKTLLLRYYEGLSPAQIAKLQGIPGATVRTHLHRGLQKLRERLDAENGGDRKAWTVLLQPLAWPKPWLLTPQASWIGVALMASVGVWWIASGGFGFERGPSSLSGTQVAAGVADPMADPAIPDPMRRIAGRSEDATTSEWNLTLVDSEQGRPLPHYRLRTASGEWESDASGLVRLPAGTASIQPINRAGLRREVEDLHGSPTEQSKTYAPTALEGQPSARQLVVPSGPTLALQADWPVDPKRVDFEARLGSPFANSEGERIWEVAPLATGDSPFGNPWVRFGHFPPPTSGPDARLQLEVRDRAGFWWGSTWIDLPTPGPEATVRVELRARGVLQGRMLVPLTALGGLARISLVGSDPAKKVIHQVDASSDGTFQCLWIEPGDYVMHVEQAGCEPWASDL